MSSFSSSDIPIISISPLTKTNDHFHRFIADQFDQKLPTNDCIGITGHGIPSELLAEAFRVVKSSA
ncbi:hypothetical protein PMIN07_006287 [Paraphaeosphaeria minitans]